MKAPLVIPFWLSCASALSLGEMEAHRFDKVIIIPDIHGDLEYLMYSIWLGATKTNWPDMTYEVLEDILVNGSQVPPPMSSPDRVALVQLGDVANRGPGTKQCYSILFSLEEIFGWHVQSIFGNHELMALTKSDAKYVCPHDYKFFGGKTNREAEFSPDGKLWKSINSKYTLAARLGSGATRTALDTLFIHGGVDMEWFSHIGTDTSSGIDINELNQLVRRTMWKPEAAKEMLAQLHSPLWTRSFAELSGDESWCSSKLDEILEAFNVSRIVVGHTPLAGKRALTRCNGKILLTDVQLSRWMQTRGQPVAVVMTVGTPSQLSSITAYYFDPSSGEQESHELLHTVSVTEAPDSDPVTPQVNFPVPSLEMEEDITTTTTQQDPPEQDRASRVFKALKMFEKDSPASVPALSCCNAAGRTSDGHSRIGQRLFRRTSLGSLKDSDEDDPLLSKVPGPRNRGSSF